MFSMQINQLQKNKIKNNKFISIKHTKINTFKITHSQNLNLNHIENNLHAVHLLQNKNIIFSTNKNVCKSTLSIAQNPKIYTKNESTLSKNQYYRNL